MHKDARKSRNFRQGESTETLPLNSAAQSKAKRRHFILCELSRLSLELNATHIHIFESVYKRARNMWLHVQPKWLQDIPLSVFLSRLGLQDCLHDSCATTRLHAGENSGDQARRD